MKTPLTLPDNDIIHAVNNAFSLAIVHLEFIPAGEASWLYKATAETGEQLVVKIQKSVAAAPSEVIAQLTEHHYQWIPESFLTAELLLWANAHGYYFSVQRFVDSEQSYEADSSPDNTYLEQVGRALAALHSQPFEPAKLPHVESEPFTLEGVATARQLLADILSNTDDNEHIQRARRVLQIHKASIEQLFVNLTTYTELLSTLPRKLTIVHGDMHFGNILAPKNDHLYLVDWDNAKYSLPEKDIMFYSDDQIQAVSKGYGRNLLEDRVVVQYFRNYLVIRALIFFLEKLTHGTVVDTSAADKIVEIFDMGPFMRRALASEE